MSTLGSYAEKRGNLPEKAPDAGLLDRRRLEIWRYSHKYLLHKSNRSSVSSSNQSSTQPIDESSVHFGRGRSCSPARQRKNPSSLRSHLISTPNEGTSQVIKSSKEQEKSLKTLGLGLSAERKQQEKTNSNLKTAQESETLAKQLFREVASTVKVKQCTEEDKFMKKAEKKVEEKKVAHPEQEKTTFFIVPRSNPHNKFVSVSKFSDSTTVLDQRVAETSQRSFQPKEVLQAALSPNSMHSRLLPNEVVGSRPLQIEVTSSIDAERNDLSSERLCSVPLSSVKGISPFRCRNLEDSRSPVIPPRFRTNDTSEVSDLKLNKVASEKVRSMSPFRRFSFSMGITGRSSSSKDSSSPPKCSSMYVSAKSTTGKATSSTSIDNPSLDKPRASSRGRSSPLKRLFEPLMRPKTANRGSVAERLQIESKFRERSCKLSETQPYSSKAPAAEVKLESCMASNIKELQSSAVQALLRVTFKNGQPLFTFAVDKESDVLAATLKKLTDSEKNDCGCIYTFFTIQEVKKKTGKWLNQGGKDQGQDYIPNVVAQMRVSGSRASNLIGAIRMDQCSLKEFVLFAVDSRQADQQSSDLRLTEELAAIIIKIPKKLNRTSVVDVSQADKNTDERYNHNYEKTQKQPSVCSQDISATVILPGGVHSLPHKGGPSSLIQRWKTGGSCDCGGWDVGCNLRIFANRHQPSKKSSSSKASLAEGFELSFLGGHNDTQPFFSLTPFKDSIYSVDFNSSLSLLQAFSVCIAVWESRKLYELSDPKNSIKDKSLD